MNPVQLRAFHAVATQRSFTGAARALGVTQPTVSSQVGTLEDRYGVRLFDRTGRAVAPTDVGARLHAVTRRLFALEQEAEEILSAARALETGRLRVGADGPHHAIPLLARFARRHPGLDVSLDMGNADAVLHDLLESRTDVAVLARVGPDPRLHARPLRESRLVFIVPRRHAWARREGARLRDVASERLVLRERGSVTRQILERALAGRQVRPAAIMEIESREAVREAVAAGLGVGVVSEAEHDPDRRVKVVPISDSGLEITEHVVCLEERRRLRIVRAFFDVASETAA